jgi:hypothetical protein
LDSWFNGAVQVGSLFIVYVGVVPFAWTKLTMAQDTVHSALGGWDICNVAEACGITNVCHSADPVKHNMLHMLHKVLEVLQIFKDPESPICVSEIIFVLLSHLLGSCCIVCFLTSFSGFSLWDPWWHCLVCIPCD